MREFKNPAATVDIIIEKKDKILLVKRKHQPYQGCWALPGGFLEYGKESLEQAARRELREETSMVVEIEDLALFGNYSSPGRDPRGHVISHAYYAKNFNGIEKADDDAKELTYFPINNLPELAFDHGKIIKDFLAWKESLGGRKC